MADLTKTVGIIFSGEDQSASSSANKINEALKGVESQAGATSTSLKQFGADLETATQPMANLAVGALKFEAGLLTAGAAVTIFATKVASDFDTSFRQLTTLFDAGAEDIAGFRSDILEFASSSTKPVQDITEALQAAVGSGVKYSESLALIATAEKLAVATRADLKGTTEVLVSTINSYGASTSEAGKFSDIFFRTIDEGKIEMNELAASLALVTPLAAASGVSIEEVGAAIATLTAAGIPAGAAVEYLRSLLTNIVKPSEQAADMAETLGIKFDAARLKSVGLSGVLNDVAKATEGNTGQMSRLVGDVGGLVAALALTGPQAERFAEILKAMGDSAGATEAAFAKMSDSLGNSMARVGSAFNTLLIGVGTPLLNEFGGIADGIARIFVALSDGVKGGSLSSLVSYIETVVGGLQSTIDTVAQNLPAALAKADLSGFTRGIDAVAAGFSKLFANINLTTVDGLTNAIEFAGAAFLGLSKFTEGVIESFKPLFDFLVKLAEGAVSVDSGFFQLAGNFAGAVTQINLLAGGINNLLPVLEALFAVLTLKGGIGIVGALLSLGPAGAAAGAGATALIAGAGGIAAVVGAAAAGIAYLETKSRDSIAAFDAQTAAMQKTDVALGGYTIKLTDIQQPLAGMSDQLIKGGEGFLQFSESIKGSEDKVGNFVVKIADLPQPLAAMSDQLLKAEEANLKFDASLLKAAEKTDAAAASFIKFAQSNQTVFALVDETTGKLYDITASVDGVAKSSERYIDVTKRLVAGQKDIYEIVDASTGKVIGYEQAVGKAAATTSASSTAAAKSAAEMKKAEEATAKLALELEKLASNERIKTMEFKAQIDVARIQADAEKVKAAFQSINVGIESTGDVLKSVFGLFDKLGSLDSTAYRAVFDQIDKENSLREKSFELQKKLTEAQIENMRAQTRQLESGDALIKIDGAGLQPQLEAFMWEILRTIQTRVNRDGLKMLLGV